MAQVDVNLSRIHIRVKEKIIISRLQDVALPYAGCMSTISCGQKAGNKHQAQQGQTLIKQDNRNLIDIHVQGDPDSK